MSAVLAHTWDEAGNVDILAHIAWLGAMCERCLTLAAKYEGLDAATADTLRATAAVHARSAQTWAEDLATGRGA